MILALKKDDYKLVASVLNGAFDSFVINAIVEELVHGRIWVDNKAYPTTGFIWDMLEELLLPAGPRSNSAFNQSLSRLVNDEIVPLAKQHACIACGGESKIEINRYRMRCDLEMVRHG